MAKAGTETRTRAGAGGAILELVPRDPAGRPPPHNLDAEAAVLAAMVLEPETTPACIALLRPDDFHSDANRRIFQSIDAIWRSGSPLDLVTLAAYMQDREWLRPCGGRAYLAQLIDLTPSVHNVVAHAKIVARLSRRRQIIAAGQTFAAEGYGDVEDEWELSVIERITSIAQPPADDTRSSMRTAMKSSMELLNRMAVQQGGMLGIPTPSMELNGLLGGHQEAELTMLGAPRGGGKTSYMLQLAITCAQSATWEPWIGDACQIAAARYQGLDTKKPPERILVPNGAMLFSLEAPTNRLGLKAQCMHGRVDGSRIRNGTMQSSDWDRLTAAAKILSTLPIEIDEQARLRIIQLRARLQRVMAEMAARGIRLRLCGVDYVQIMECSDLVKSEANANRERQLAALSEAFIELKKKPEFRFITWLLLIQLNKDGTARESQALENAADNILVIRCEKPANPASADHPVEPQRAKITITKQRNGITDRVAETWFHAQYGLFQDDDYVRQEVNF